MKNIYLKIRWNDWPLFPVFNSAIRYGWKKYLTLNWLCFGIEFYLGSIEEKSEKETAISVTED